MDYKTKVELKLDAEGPEVPGPIQSFELRRIEKHYTRRANSSVWQEDYSAQKREIIGDGITRRMLSELIAEAADWLVYVEGEDS